VLRTGKPKSAPHPCGQKPQKKFRVRTLCGQKQKTQKPQKKTKPKNLKKNKAQKQKTAKNKNAKAQN